MGALSWVTVSINAHNFVTDVISGTFASDVWVTASFQIHFHLQCAGIPVYGNQIIQNATPETADVDSAFVSLFKKCIISLAKHVQTVSCRFFAATFCFLVWG
jgi:hypothetical protein